MRVTIIDDSVLITEGLTRLLEGPEVEILDRINDVDRLLPRIAAAQPDVVVIDIKMPPTFTDEGLVAARSLRRSHPEIGILVLSQYLESAYATRLLQDVPERAGYLLKERVADRAVLLDALRRICEGECVVDPTIVTRLVRSQRAAGPLRSLTGRERDVLALMAQGRSNSGIGRELFLSEKTVEAHVRHAFTKLELPGGADDHRRVLAVLAYLRSM